jgi:hypothetical protein
VIDIDSNTQVAEYRGQIGTKEYGHLLVGIATEYNEALLVVENASIGWATIQTVIDRGYSNLYYSPKSDSSLTDSYFDKYMDTSKMTPGFTMSSRLRPMVIGKFQEYINDRSVVIHSRRLLEEMKVFIWKNGRAEAQQGYNDDLVMSFGMAMFMRDTSYKFRQQNLDASRSTLNNITANRYGFSGGYNSNQIQNPYMHDLGGNKEDIRWLL